MPSIEHIARVELENARDNKFYDEYIDTKNKIVEAKDRKDDPSERWNDSGYEPRTTPPVTRSSAAQPDARIGMLRVMESVQETEWSAKRMMANRAAIARGVVQEDARTWRRNRGAPDPPLTSYSHASNTSDKRCNNCFRFHPDQRGRTSWFTCPKQLDADHQEKAEHYFARTSKRARVTDAAGTNHPQPDVALIIAVLRIFPPTIAEDIREAQMMLATLGGGTDGRDPPLDALAACVEDMHLFAGEAARAVTSIAACYRGKAARNSMTAVSDKVAARGAEGPQPVAAPRTTAFQLADVR